MAVDPDILAALEDEREYANSQAKYSNRLTLERGDTALVRFLPVQMGTRKQWFLRVGRHWINRRPYFCKRVSSPDAGGDPDYVCPLCDLCDQYMQDKDEETANEAFRASANPQWMLYCIVWERGDRGREPAPVPKSELYVPYEIWITRDAWLELSSMFKRSLRANEPGNLGILDARTGCDIWLTKDRRGVLHFDKRDSEAIDPKDPVGLMQRILAKVKVQEFRPVSGEKLDDALNKLEDAVTRRRGRRGEGDDDRGPRRGASAEDDRSDYPRRGDGRDSDRGRDDRGGRDEPRGGRRYAGEDDAGGEPPRRGESSDRRRDEPPPERRRDDPPPERRRDEPASRRGEGNSRAEEPAGRRGDEPLPRRGEESRQESRREEPPAGRSLEPLDDDDRSAEDDRPSGGAEPGDEPPPPVRASPPPSVRRTGPLPPPPARGRIADDAEEVAPESRDPAPPAGQPSDRASAKPRLSDAVRKGVRAVQDAAGEGGAGGAPDDALPPPRRTDGGGK